MTVLRQKTALSLGTEDNPWPRWAIFHRSDVQDICLGAGKEEHQFFSELLPALVSVVRRVEQVLRGSGREDCREFCAENILRISEGKMLVRIFTCVNGHCHVPAEGPLADGIHRIRELGWQNLDFDFSS